MFDLGWSKLIVIAIIAIVVVGPKDLPPLLRALGKFIAQLRRQADEFRTHFNEAMRDTGFDEIKRDVAGIKAAATSTAYDIGRQLDESVKPLHDAAADIQRAGQLDVAGAADVPGDPVSSYVNGHAPGVTDMPEVQPQPALANGYGDASPAVNGHGEASSRSPAAPEPVTHDATSMPKHLEVATAPAALPSAPSAVPHKTQVEA